MSEGSQRICKEQLLLDQIKAQIAWYSQKCKRYKRLDFWLTVAVLLTSSLIPPIIVLDFTATKVVIAFLSAMIVFLEGYRSFAKYKELWLIYRASLEKLKKELLFYDICFEPYSDEQNRVEILAAKYRLILDSEHENWGHEVSINQTRETE